MAGFSFRIYLPNSYLQRKSCVVSCPYRFSHHERRAGKIIKMESENKKNIPFDHIPFDKFVKDWEKTLTEEEIETLNQYRKYYEDLTDN